MILFRGCRLQDVENLTIGGYLEMLGYLSCSSDRSVVER